MVRRWGRLVGALAVLLALVGCAPSQGEEVPSSSGSGASGSVEPGTGGSGGGSSEPTEPTEPSQVPEVDAPVRPEAMDEETVDGAIAAARYFMELYPYIYATGDLTEWDALSDEGCEFCRNSRDLAVEVTSDGGYATGGEVDIVSQDGGGPYEDDVYAVQLNIRFAPSTFVYGDGSTESHNGVERPDFRLSMAWRDGSWVVLGVLANPAEADDT